MEQTVFCIGRLEIRAKFFKCSIQTCASNISVFRINKFFNFLSLIKKLRSFDLVYLSKSSLNGIETLDFHMRNDIFANFTNNPLNKGFCNEMSSESSCSTNGLFNTSNCNTMPIILSQPHFLNADKSLIESIKGISPDSSLHDSILHFQPVSQVYNY